MKKYHYISGLPRSGSTLLTAILRQNPRFHSDIQDPLYEIVSSCISTMNVPTHKAFVDHDRMRNTLLAAINGFYCRVDKEVIFNTHRLWTKGVEYLNGLDPSFKIICCVRDYRAVLNSFEIAFKRKSLTSPSENHPVYGTNTLTVWHRTNWLAQDSFVRVAYNALKEAYYGPYRDRLLLVEYDHLTHHPKQTMQAIYEFIGEPYFEHNFDSVEYSNDAHDAILGLPGLHTVKKKVASSTTEVVLPPDLMRTYENWEFWR